MIALTQKERKILLILFKDFTTFYNANSISKIVGVSRVGAMKMLKRSLNAGLLIAKKIGKSIVYKINLKDDYTRKLISFLLADEANNFKRWKEEFKDEPWYIGDTYHFAIGQGDILVTPLQVANYTAVIANGGTLYSPQLVDKFGYEYETAEKLAPEILDSDVASASSISIIRQGLRDVVTYGTARSLSSLTVPVAGKTGTAQFSQTKEPHAWFTGFAPYDDAEIAVTVLLEEGDKSDYAVRAAKEGVKVVRLLSATGCRPLGPDGRASCRVPRALSCRKVFRSGRAAGR